MKRKALFVGINDYEGGLVPLNCACKDANDLCDYFRDVLRYDTHVLRNADILEVRKKINEVTKDLQRGDVFLFFFAGHGFTVDKGENTDRRLATARDPKDHLEDGEGGISLRRLRRLTKGGYSRVFILDACQTKINAIRAADEAEKKTVSKRDLSIISSIVRTTNEVDDVAPLWVINSCNVGDVAYELENNGLFTWAFIETLTNLRERGEAVVFNADLVSNIANRMRMHPGQFNQTPVFFASDEGTPEISVFGDALSSAGAASMSVSRLVLCPICGKKNKVEDTFRCRQCGSDNLCLRHQDEKTFLCFNCAEKGTQKIAKDRTNVIQDSVKGVQLWEGGPYWADRNIGAENPWDSGYYFWWGDTVGYKRVNDKWVASDGSVSNFLFDESNVSTYGKIKLDLQREGWINNSGILISQKDAAQVCWGGEWRIPTYDELKELYSKCVWVWTELNGACGYIIHGQGNYASASIFLPVAGCGCRNSLNFVNSDGLYWSSKVYEPITWENMLHGNQYCNMAWTLNLTPNKIDTFFASSCYFGQSIRPVQGFRNN